MKIITTVPVSRCNHRLVLNADFGGALQLFGINRDTSTGTNGTKRDTFLFCSVPAPSLKRDTSGHTPIRGVFRPAFRAVPVDVPLTTENLPVLTFPQSSEAHQ